MMTIRYLSPYPLPYRKGLTTTLPTNHAGHQTHQTTTCDHNPLTLHPNAASANISPTSTPQALHATNITTGGLSSCSNTLHDNLIATLRRGAFLWSLPVFERDGKGWPRKDRGVQSRPIRNAREKLRVARVARNMPRRRREKQWERRRWCGVRGA